MVNNAEVVITQEASTKLIPIRIDVTSNDDRLVRIVDTLLFDPSCWPVPLYHPLHEAIEDNVVQIACCVLSDAEVQNMGRNNRHFTNRVDIWSKDLKKRAEDQLRSQLWKIATGNVQVRLNKKIPIPISIRLMVDGIVINDDILWDPNGIMTPFEFAEDMSKELKLPEEATISIAITICEQLNGLSIDRTDESTNFVTINGSDRGSKFGAWILDPKERASSEYDVVAEHKRKK